MSIWPSTRANQVIAALLRIGWQEIRVKGSHRVFRKEGFTDIVFAFHNRTEIGSAMLARIAKQCTENMKSNTEIDAVFYFVAGAIFGVGATEQSLDIHDGEKQLDLTAEVFKERGWPYPKYLSFNGKDRPWIS